MKKNFYFIVIAALFFVACQKSEDLDFSEQNFEIRATIEDEEMTKVSLDFDSSPLVNVWNYGDKLYMASENGTEASKRTFDWSNEFEISNIASASATAEVGYFKGVSEPQKINIIAGDNSNQKYLAIVSPNKPNNNSVGYLTINIPNNQEYQEKSIKPGYLAMYSLSDSYSSMSFKSLVSILRVKVKDSSNNGETIKSIVLDPEDIDKSDSNDNSGAFHRGFAGRSYIWTRGSVLSGLTYGLQLADQSRAAGTLTLNCEPGGVTGPVITATEKDFYLVIGTTDYGTNPYGHSITVTTDKTTKKVGPIKKHFEIKAGKIYTTTIDIHP